MDVLRIGIPAVFHDASNIGAHTIEPPVCGGARKPMNRSSSPPSPNQAVFEVNWGIHNSAETAVSPVDESLEPLYLAWRTLVAVVNKEYADFIPIHEFVAWMGSEMPEIWDWSNPKSAIFLDRLDQLEDLGWALDLKAASSK